MRSTRASLCLTLAACVFACGAPSRGGPDGGLDAGVDDGTGDAGPGDAGVLDAGLPDGGGAAPDGGPAARFVLWGPTFVDGGADAGLILPRDYTCDADGGGISPPLAWDGVPQGTQTFALLATTLARDGLKYNWVVWGIPGAARGLDAGSTGGGTAGITSDGPQLAWAPPCSQGPGAKQYTFTLYALSAMPVISNPPRTETGAALAADIAPVTLDQAQVTVSSTRP